MSDHGRFIWYELTTPSTAGAKVFYAGLMGWDCDDIPMPEMSYMIVGPGFGVGGIMEMSAEVKSQGAPPNWTGYVCVDDCDAAAAKVTQLGGAVISPPLDIPGIGRFAIVADPAGATFAIMKPIPPEGGRPAPDVTAVGQTGWHELYGGDPKTGFAFYAEMFGWTEAEAIEMGPMGVYQLFNTQDGEVGGMMAKPPQIPAPCWVYYFRVADIDAAAATIKSGGGQIMMGPLEAPNGDWIIQGADPQGAMFAVTARKD